MRLILEEFSGISLVEEKWLKESPNCLVTPMFGHNVSRIEFARQMVEANKFGGNSFADMVKGENVVAFVELGMWNGRAVHNGLVIAKHVAHLTDRNTKITECGAKINHLVNTSARSNEFRSVGGSFDSGLFLGVPIDGRLIHEVQDARDRASCQHVMIKVSVDIVRQGDILAKRSRSVLREDLGDIAVNCLGPIEVLGRKPGVIWLRSANANHDILHLGQLAIDTFDSIKMAAPGHSAEA